MLFQDRNKAPAALLARWRAPLLLPLHRLCSGQCCCCAGSHTTTRAIGSLLCPRALLLLLLDKCLHLGTGLNMCLCLCLCLCLQQGMCHHVLQLTLTVQLLQLVAQLVLLLLIDSSLVLCSKQCTLQLCGSLVGTDSTTCSSCWAGLVDASLKVCHAARCCH